MRMSYDRGTLLDRLFRKRNCTDPLLHLYKSGVLIETLSMSDIYRNALARSLFIRNTYDVKNGIVLIEGCNDSNFIYNFFAIQLAGYVPVPLPSDLWMEDQRHLEILRSIQTNCRSNLLIAGARTSEKVAGDFNDNECFDVLLDSDVGELSCLPVAVKGRDNDSNQSERIVLPVGDDLAHLQFSSGSTGLPKGVMISHSNLMANIRQIYESGRVNVDSDVMVSWLPVHHDMGLVTSIFMPIYGGLETHMMTPYDFATNPNRWLRLISTTKATIIHGPNTGYHLSVKKVRSATLKKLDLSSVRVALCAAEPINVATMRQFCDVFDCVGFQATAILPAYGMAESTLAVTFGDLDSEMRIDYIDKDIFYSTGQALPVNASVSVSVSVNKAVDKELDIDNSDGIELVSCGKPLFENVIRIVDDQDNVLAERYVGNILIGGPCVSRGYYNRPDLNENLFCEGLLRTGDMGYLADGELYISGRKKDMIIINGQNINAEEVENQVLKLPEIIPGRLVAFATSNDDSFSERIHLVVEYKVPSGICLTDSIGQFKARLASHISRFITVKQEHISVVSRGSILHTSSGKVRRLDMKILFENGGLTELVNE